MTMVVSLADLAGAGRDADAVAGDVADPVRASAPRPGAPRSRAASVLRRVIRVYEVAVRAALRFRWLTVGMCLVVLAGGVRLYRRLDTEFLPPMDEGGFVIDYFTPPGTSLSETNRQLLQAETILRSVPEVESYSRRTGARLALAIAEPNTGDFLVKLKANRARPTDEVISELRRRFNAALPGVNWEFPGVLSDLIGDLTWAPQPDRDQDVLDRHRVPQGTGAAGRGGAPEGAGRRRHLRRPGVRGLDAAPAGPSGGRRALRPDRGGHRHDGEHRHARADRVHRAGRGPRRRRPRHGRPVGERPGRDAARPADPGAGRARPCGSRRW